MIDLPDVSPDDQEAKSGDVETNAQVGFEEPGHPDVEDANKAGSRSPRSQDLGAVVAVYVSRAGSDRPLDLADGRHAEMPARCSRNP